MKPNRSVTYMDVRGKSLSNLGHYITIYRGHLVEARAYVTRMGKR